MLTTQQASLFVYLSQLPDPRKPQGLRHPIVAILAGACCALLCGMRSFSAIAQWVRLQEPCFWHQLGFRRKPPSLNTYRQVFLKLDPEVLEALLQRWIEETTECNPQELEAYAMDGKTLRGSLKQHQQAVHLLSLMEHKTAGVLCQTQVDSNTNEHKAAFKLLDQVELEGKLITGDSIFCQRDLCQTIVDRQGHYLFQVKENQPSLLEAIQADFQPAFSPLRREATTSLLGASEKREQGTWADRNPRSPSQQPLGETI